MRDFEIQPIGFEPEPVQAATVEKKSNNLEKIIIVGIMMIPVLCIVVGFILYYSTVTDSLDDPVIGPLPEGWVHDQESEFLSDLFDLPGSQFDIGFLGCTKSLSNSIEIWYSDASLFAGGIRYQAHRGKTATCQ